MGYIIDFGSDWFAKVAERSNTIIATGDKGRATVFDTEKDARQALKEKGKFIQPSRRKTAIFREV